MDTHTHCCIQNESTHSTNMWTDHISQTSTPLNTSGGRKAERAREGKKWWSRTWTSNNKQSIKSVAGRVWVGGARGVRRQISGGLGWGGLMRVYLKHGDPVAEGCLGAGMNKTLMAHKTQRTPSPSLASQRLFLPRRPIRLHESLNTGKKTERGKEREKERRNKSDRNRSTFRVKMWVSSCFKKLCTSLPKSCFNTIWVQHIIMFILLFELWHLSFTVEVWDSDTPNLVSSTKTWDQNLVTWSSVISCFFFHSSFSQNKSNISKISMVFCAWTFILIEVYSHNISSFS